MQVEILGARVDALDLKGAVERVAEFIREGQPRQVITLNPEILYRAQKDPQLLSVINSADLVTADGVGVVWAARVFGRPLPARVTGIDLMLALVARAAREGWRVFFLGAAPGVAEEAARRLKERHPGLVVAGTQHGYFQAGAEEPGSGTAGVPPAQAASRPAFSPSEKEVVEQIKAAGPDLLFVALGAPKQELFIARHKEELGAKVAVGVGGSFDVVAGKARRAPAWMRRLGLEWLGRLLMEPRRFRRMTVLPRFAWLVLKESRRQKFGGRNG